MAEENNFLPQESSDEEKIRLVPGAEKNYSRQGEFGEKEKKKPGCCTDLLAKLKALFRKK